MRGHRIFRVLAARLAREQSAVLRFDYHATGDSPGDDEAGDLAGWTQDVGVALRELVARSGVTRVVCVGARLGATLALRGAAASLGETARLVLWDPVVDGDELSRAAAPSSMSRRSSPPSACPIPRGASASRTIPRPSPKRPSASACPRALRAQIRELGPQSLPLPPGIDLHVLAHPADAQVNAWLASEPVRAARSSHWPLEESFDWTAGERRGSPIVPAPALARLMATIRG